MGMFCERCKPGYVGNATLGSVTDCKRLISNYENMKKKNICTFCGNVKITLLKSNCCKKK